MAKIVLVYLAILWDQVLNSLNNLMTIFEWESVLNIYSFIKQLFFLKDLVNKNSLKEIVL